MRIRSLLFAVLVSLLASFAGAQEFPSKPIRLLVGEALDAFLLKDRAANTELVAKLGLGMKKKP